MKKLLGIGIAILGLLAFSGPSSAQILWGTVNPMTGDPDVSVAGSYIDAATFGTSSETINGVKFNPISSGSDGADISVTNYRTVAYAPLHYCFAILSRL